MATTVWGYTFSGFFLHSTEKVLACVTATSLFHYLICRSYDCLCKMKLAIFFKLLLGFSAGCSTAVT